MANIDLYCNIMTSFKNNKYTNAECFLNQITKLAASRNIKLSSEFLDELFVQYVHGTALIYMAQHDLEKLYIDCKGITCEQDILYELLGYIGSLQDQTAKEMLSMLKKIENFYCDVINSIHKLEYELLLIDKSGFGSKVGLISNVLKRIGCDSLKESFENNKSRHENLFKNSCLLAQEINGCVSCGFIVQEGTRIIYPLVITSEAFYDVYNNIYGDITASKRLYSYDKFALIDTKSAVYLLNHSKNIEDDMPIWLLGTLYTSPKEETTPKRIITKQ